MFYIHFSYFCNLLHLSQVVQILELMDLICSSQKFFFYIEDKLFDLFVGVLDHP